MYQWLDRSPKGRNETGVWWRRHDEYDRESKNKGASKRLLRLRKRNASAKISETIRNPVGVYPPRRAIRDCFEFVEKGSEVYAKT